MKDFLDSLAEHFSHRVKSQLYGTFGFWWIVIHWQFFYSLIFLDQNLILKKTGLLKDTYLRRTYFDYSNFFFWVRSVLPFLLTYLTIWWFSRLLLIAYRKEKNDEYDRNLIKIEVEQKLEKRKATLEEKKIEQLDVTTERVQKEQAVESLETSTWNKEYEALKKSNIWPHFDELVDCLYSYKGRVKYVGSGVAHRPEFQLDKDMLAYADSNNLVNYDRQDDHISLTDKGKYFVKQYQSQT